jgi:hypothetical protein
MSDSISKQVCILTSASVIPGGLIEGKCDGTPFFDATIESWHTRVVHEQLVSSWLFVTGGGYDVTRSM